MNVLQKMKLGSLQKKLQKFFELRQQEKASQSDIKKEIELHYELANFYKEHLYDSDVPHAKEYMLESYRTAAILGDLNALYELGKQLLDEAKFWEAMSTSAYGCKVHQKYKSDFYEEALTYLKSAEEQGHALAKRLYGMVLIQGWGTKEDKEKGFQLIVDSIEIEKAWDRATKIFEDLGLNKPEFFSAIMSIKQKK